MDKNLKSIRYKPLKFCKFSQEQRSLKNKCHRGDTSIKKRPPPPWRARHSKSDCCFQSSKIYPQEPARIIPILNSTTHPFHNIVSIILLHWKPSDSQLRQHLIPQVISYTPTMVWDQWNTINACCKPAQHCSWMQH